MSLDAVKSESPMPLLRLDKVSLTNNHRLNTATVLAQA